MAKMKREINEIRQQVIVILRHPRTRVNFIFIFISFFFHKFEINSQHKGEDRTDVCNKGGRTGFVKDRYIRRTFEMEGGGSKEE